MFQYRNFTNELLDAENIPTADLYQNLKELDFINTWLNGHSITVKGLKKLLELKHANLNATITIADVGCGGGDNLKAIARWGRKHNLKLELIGIDLKQDCIEYARRNCAAFPEISFLQNDYRHIQPSFDVIFSSLFCHHLNDEELAVYLQWCYRASNIGFFINDLHRHPLAYYSIKILTRIFSKSYLVKNDAPLSVLRGFRHRDWERLLQKAGIENYRIEWMWAFRHLVMA